MKKAIKFLTILCLTTYLFVSCNNDDDSTEIENPVIQTISLSSPLNGGSDISTLPSLQWEEIISEEEVTYNVYLGETPEVLSLQAEGLTISNYDIVDELDNSTLYYWSVEAVNTNGVIGTSVVSNFITENIEVLITILSPLNDESNISTLPLLQWELINSDEEEVTYNVYLGETPDTLSLQAEGLTVNNYDIVDELDNNTMYYWSVEAVSINGIFETSVVSGFITTKAEVLIIWDDSATNINTISLKDALIDASFNVTISDVNGPNWDNTNPSIVGFDAVIHMNGDTWTQDMPEDGQNALANFVQNEGGYYIGTEWSSWAYYNNNTLQFMEELFLFADASLGNYGNLGTYIINNEEIDHPVLIGIPNFTLDTDGVFATAIVYDTDPSTVLMNEGNNDAVVVREFTDIDGKILNFSHTGNYQGHTSFSDTNVQNIIINFINWN